MAKIDYSTMTPDGLKGSTSSVPTRWWLLDEAEMPASIASVVRTIQGNASALETQRQISRRLYGNYSVLGAAGITSARGTGVSAKANDRITYNVVQSAIDTVVSKIAKNRPKPMYLTSGGDWKLQRKAKRLEKFTEGIFYENDSYAMGPEALTNAMVDGTAAVHVFEHNGRVKWERVMISELYVDEIEAFYGKPRQLHRVKNVDRQVLVELFPEHADAIRDANASLADKVGAMQTVGDQVAVAESWHLRSGPDAKDGLHVISINGYVLEKEEYKHDFFPFVFLHWAKKLYGFWAQGAAEQIQNIQLEINKLLWVIQRSMHLAGSFKVAIENASKIVKEHLNNDFGAIITYTNNPPQYLTPPIVQAEVYQHLLTLKNAAYEQLGVSQLSASSQKPAGLDSGKALREYNDIETDRFQIIGQAYERFFLDLAKLSIAVAKDIKNLTVNVPGKRYVEKIEWKDVDLKADEYVLKLYPVSSLPQDPEGRLATIQEYAQAGFMSPQTARRLLDFPDLEAVEEMANAPEDRIHKVLCSILDGEEYTPPDEYMPTDLALQLGLQYYSHAVNCDLEPEVLANVQRFIKQVNALDMQMNPPPMPGMDPAAAGAPADPTAAPQSDLVPNVNQAA